MDRIMIAAFRDEFEKIALHKTAFIDTAPAAGAGAHKAEAAGQGLSDRRDIRRALRGGLGWAGGSTLGAVVGSLLGSALGHDAPVLPMLGYGLGGLAGYKAMTGRYNGDKVSKKR